MARSLACYRCRRWPCTCADGITLIHGEALRVLDQLDDLAEVDALITDPPYSTGGFTRGDRAQRVDTKYQSHGTIRSYHNFTGDNRDQRSFLTWSQLWLDRCRELCRPAAYALVFSDWRQLPTMTDALQIAGWVWRGIVAWDKTEASRAPHKAYFRHQAEYVAWGTAGPCPPATHAGPYPGVIRHFQRPADKQHLTAKPLPVMEALVAVAPPAGLVLDPFAGSGTTGLAAKRTGRRALLIEQEDAYCQITATRLAK